MVSHEPQPRPEPLVDNGAAPSPVRWLPPLRRAGTRWGEADVYLVVGLGGALGGLARWAVGIALPHPGDGMPWGTFLVNTTGCFLLGLLMVGVLQLWRPGRYARPFLGVGVLGGFTTFSTYTLEVRDLLAAAEYARAVAYALGSLAAGMVAVTLGTVLARLLVGLPTGRRTRHADRDQR